MVTDCILDIKNLSLKVFRNDNDIVVMLKGKKAVIIPRYNLVYTDKMT